MQKRLQNFLPALPDLSWWLSECLGPLPSCSSAQVEHSQSVENWTHLGKEQLGVFTDRAGI